MDKYLIKNILMTEYTNIPSSLLLSISGKHWINTGKLFLQRIYKIKKF